MGYYTPKEVAEDLRLNVSTIWRWIREGKLPATKIGRSYRISDEQLAKFIESQDSEGKKELE